MLRYLFLCILLYAYVFILIIQIQKQRRLKPSRWCPVREMSAGERERLQDVRRRVRSGNRDEVRALAKAWGVPQKAAGKNRSVPEMRRDLEEKIATALAEPVAGQGPRTVLAQLVAA